MMATYEQLMDAARRADSAGDGPAARRFLELARDARSATPEAPEAVAEVDQTEGRGWLANQLFGDNDPNSHNLGETIGAAINKAGESMTFGLIGDEADAFARSGGGLWGDYDESLEAVRQQERVLERDNPKTALAAEILGGMVAPVAGAGAIKAAPGLLGLGQRAVASSAATGAMAGTYGFMEGEGGAAERLDKSKFDATTGALIGAAIPFVGAGVQRAANGIAAQKYMKGILQDAPSTEALKSAGRAAYDEIDNAGVQITPDSFSGLRKEIAQHLQANGVDNLPGPGSLTPKAARVSQIMDEMDATLQATDGAALPFSSLDKLRRHAGTAAADVTNKTDAALGAGIIGKVDDYVAGLGRADVTAGDVETLQAMVPKARDLWSKMSKSQLIDDAMENADNYLSGGASGLRNQFARILRNPKLRRGFTEAEQKMLKRVAQGSVPEQILQLAAGGLGNLGAMGIGAAAAGPVGLLAGTGLAAGLRKAASATTQRNAERARAAVASGGLLSLPKTGDGARQITEQLMRQGSSASIH